MTPLPSFPVDDATLAAIEHALGGAWAADEEGNHVLVGADYSLHQLLDFLSGTMSNDSPHVEVAERDWNGEPSVLIDHRPHYTETSIITALIAEVRRLRGEG